MLLFLAFCGLVLRTSLAVPQQKQQPECSCEEIQRLTVRLDSLSKELKDLSTAFYSVHNARSFGSGSESLFVTNGQEGNFDTASSICLRAKGVVPVPANEAENNALMKTLQRHNKSAYLGKILDGYSNWAPGEPSGTKAAKTCTKIDDDGQWRATSCEEQLLITCEFSFVSHPSGAPQ
ncbi:phospholipase A2 inhibitor subunit A-like [Heteronotia binoei]|uniref:phospholipase A2 inhibitor subunit A-like n=1 Tax=Heteronotia binoei TaxID=13085 RepID=UPI00292DE57F|nr:phospholipase A2 inhibitor subunit A-like [Heteronotia binoei]